MEASKEDRGLSDFSYGCVGYSVYLDRIGKEPVTDNKQGAKPELPVCVGLEVQFSHSLCVCLMFMQLFLEFSWFGAITNYLQSRI